MDDARMEVGDEAVEWDHGCALAGAVKRLDARCSVGDMGSAIGEGPIFVLG